MVGCQGMSRYRPRWGLWKVLLLLLMLLVVVVLVVMVVGPALGLHLAWAWQHEAAQRPVAEVLEMQAVVVALL